MITIRDVSEFAGVSPATVSRVINGTTRVSHQKKLKVENAIAQLGYRPNTIAKALASSKTGSIGIVVPEVGSSFYSGILQCIEEQLRKVGYHIIVTTGSEFGGEQRDAIEFLLGRRVDALVLHTQEVSDDYLIQLSEQGIPLVLLNRTIPEIEDCCIDIDNEAGGRRATKFLLDNGHTSIACITGPLSKADARGRLQGYRHALEEAGIPYRDSLVIEAGFTEETGATAVQKLMKRNVQFSAIFACNDHMAFGVFEALSQQGVGVPEHCSLVGFDNVIFARYITPALTTIDFPIEQMSMEAVELLVHKLNKKKTDVNFKLTPSLVIRNSVKNVMNSL
ncbi:LacI family DNA-binding transcriptional regulator [Vibrio sp. SCSIO 43136]|uniref:LacI family DNA-binding transcriptional regulator n=1 Tax=Vibrio sp. SCSIO 43136 TaxID=2819101 RepID=UPI002074E4F3|nr:LacI family DNA-binding transcriptional regulator [Vibrio sp. SCSIO 43136]USD65835.1 LacI family DNA-binding transcriptional regulator [Vibrio sp. SCSIO 43136]